MTVGFNVSKLAIDENDKFARNKDFPISFLYLLDEDETKSIVEAAGYFPAINNFHVGDQIKIYSNDKTEASWYVITDIDPVAGATIALSAALS